MVPSGAAKEESELCPTTKLSGTTEEDPSPQGTTPQKEPLPADALEVSEAQSTVVLHGGDFSCNLYRHLSLYFYTFSIIPLFLSRAPLLRVINCWMTFDLSVS